MGKKAAVVQNLWKRGVMTEVTSSFRASSNHQGSGVPPEPRRFSALLLLTSFYCLTLKPFASLQVATTLYQHILKCLPLTLKVDFERDTAAVEEQRSSGLLLSLARAFFRHLARVFRGSWCLNEDFRSRSSTQVKWFPSLLQSVWKI